jgi:dihydrofolate synthase/folylpolyglutamate synthase
LTLTSYQTQLKALLELEYFGMKLGLDNIHALLKHLGNPERKYPTIHVAGTNGKGSVCSMLAACFQADGKKVGLFTSPHLVDYRERIRVSGEMISESALLEIAEKLWPEVLERRATFFETTTAIAFEHFAREQVDIAIIETGLGGRLDATNVLERPLATVITSIGMDHMQQLGDTLELIAGEKAGIMKPGVPAIVSCPTSVRHIFESRSRALDAPLIFVEDESVDLNGLTPSLGGEHQLQNLRSVLVAFGQLESPPQPQSVAEGIRRTAELTGLRARLQDYASPEFEARGVRLVLDAGHNEDAMRAVSEHFRSTGVRPIIIAGFMRDKALEPALDELRGCADRFIAVQAESKRALLSEELSALAREAGFEVRNCGAVMAGVAEALQWAARGETVLLTGSHYVIGEFLANERTLRAVVQSEAHAEKARA